MVVEQGQCEALLEDDMVDQGQSLLEDDMVGPIVAALFGST